MEGTPFGRYLLVELLGRGGMGEVWRALDTAIDRVVALKLLAPQFAGDQQFQQRFQREARAAAGLNEPHVVPIYDVGEVDGRLYVTMRLVDGRDLQAVLAAGPLDIDRAVRIVEQIAAALHAAHHIGLVHRDVKPSNILVGDEDFAYLIDFGIARAVDETGITNTGTTIGTWAYMAPERFGTGKLSPSQLTDLVRRNFSLTPKGIIESLDLHAPVSRREVRLFRHDAVALSTAAEHRYRNGV